MGKQLELTFDFAPWQQLEWCCKQAKTEVGFMGITSHEDPLQVISIYMPVQECSPSWCEFDDNDIAEHMERQGESGVEPFRCMRVWIHTHPGDSPEPSSKDWETFDEKFGSCEFAVMFILARGGSTSCHLRTSTSSLDRAMRLSAKVRARVLPPQSEVTLKVQEWKDDLESKVSDRPYRGQGNLHIPGGLIPTGSPGLVPLKKRPLERWSPGKAKKKGSGKSNSKGKTKHVDLWTPDKGGFRDRLHTHDLIQLLLERDPVGNTLEMVELLSDLEREELLRKGPFSRSDFDSLPLTPEGGVF